GTRRPGGISSCSRTKRSTRSRSSSIRRLCRLFSCRDRHVRARHLRERKAQRLRTRAKRACASEAGRALKNKRAIRQLAGHPDRVIEAERRLVLRPHEQADGRDVLEQQPAEIGERPARVAAPPC